MRTGLTVANSVVDAVWVAWFACKTLIRRASIHMRIRDLERSVSLAEKMLAVEQTMKLTRILTSMGDKATVTGTQSEIDAAARRMSRRTKACVVVSVIVGYYHRKDCADHPPGGLVTEGN